MYKVPHNKWATHSEDITGGQRTKEPHMTKAQQIMINASHLKNDHLIYDKRTTYLGMLYNVQSTL